MDAAADPHNMRDRNDIFQRFLNHLQVARTFRPPPKPTPMPSPAPTEVWINLVCCHFIAILANCDSQSLHRNPLLGHQPLLCYQPNLPNLQQ
jgi:hypothetical protein